MLLVLLLLSVVCPALFSIYLQLLLARVIRSLSLIAVVAAVRVSERCVVEVSCESVLEVALPVSSSFFGLCRLSGVLP